MSHALITGATRSIGIELAAQLAAGAGKTTTLSCVGSSILATGLVHSKERHVVVDTSPIDEATSLGSGHDLTLGPH